MAQLVLGVVADDFTGASDAASFLVSAGVPTILYSGTPEEKPVLAQDSAVVIALKTRTAPLQQAVEESLAAFQWLKDLGAQKLYLKYCSTFDSTPQGNIGPVVDAVMDRWGLTDTVLCPSLPVNGRTVKNGCLYVNGIPLAQSHMRHHPLTPMRESQIDRLMEQQSQYKCTIVSCEALFADVPLCHTEENARYWIPDYYEEAHADKIAEVFEHLLFWTGGSGLIGALGRRISRGIRHTMHCANPDTTPGKSLILAGSCSKATLGQIADHIRKGLPACRIYPEALMEGTQSADTLWEQLQHSGSSTLIYSSAELTGVVQSPDREQVAAQIETTLSQLAKKAVAAGYTRIIVAGGETSGAITKALGYRSFSIGTSVAPGVPIMTPLENPSLRIVLKSGNFGQEDFFTRARNMTREKL